MTTPFIGEIQLFGFNFAPRSWAFCDGKLLPISQNSALFSLIGTTYGGDGKTTFQLPDLQERAACNQGMGPGLSQRNIGASFGANTATLTSAQMPAHSHSMTAFITSDASVRASSPSAGNGLTFPLSAQTFANEVAPDAPLASASTGDRGGGQAHENQQPYLAINFSIALAGVFPSFP